MVRLRFLDKATDEVRSHQDVDALHRLSSPLKTTDEIRQLKSISSRIIARKESRPCPPLGYGMKSTVVHATFHLVQCTVSKHALIQVLE